MIIIGMAMLAVVASLVIVGPSYAATLAVAPVATSELSDDEIDGLLYMREEEKLAHDVYQVLCEKWGLTIFDNITTSEQRHTDAIKTLLDSYGLPDPALQALYDQLVEQGSQSLEDALLVGASIEEID